MLAMEKAIYVTGITGFIGRNLLSYLSKKFIKVINFTRRDTIQIIEKGHISEHEASSDLLQKNPSRVLINLATLYDPYPKTSLQLKNLIESNILFPSRVLELLRDTGNLKIINALSYHQLLDFSCQNVYSLSKELFKIFLAHQSQEIVNIYIFDTFGAGDTREKVTDTFIQQILAGHPITIPKNNININLSDSEAISTSLMHSIQLSSGSYSLLSPNTISLELLALTIMDMVGVEVEIIKKSIGNDYLSSVQALPENIFIAPSGYSFENSLKKRINEIESKK
jgi:nucleoside-diphosphate-sugar epimerase